MSEGVAEGIKLTFGTNPDGVVSRVDFAIEPALAPVTFDRQAAQLSADMRARYAGAYRLGTVTITVVEQGDGLVMNVPGQPRYLLDATPEPHTFAVGTLPGYRVRFELDGEKVARIVLLQPNGTFRADRVE